MVPIVRAVVDELLERHRAEGRVHLNDVAEVIGLRAVSYEEVEAIIEELEAEGLAVGEELDARDVEIMRDVLAAARKLAAELGRRPTVDELAAACGRPARIVRRALESASISR